MVTAAAGSVALVIGPMVHQHGVGYIYRLSFWRVLFKFCLVCAAWRA